MAIQSGGREPSKLVTRLLVRRRFLKNKTVKTLAGAIDGFFRHPATLLLIGFVLTAIVGSQIQRSQQKADKEATVLAQANEAAGRIIIAISEFSIRGHLLTASATAPVAQVPSERFTEASLKGYSTYMAQISAVVAPYGDDLGLTKLTGDVGVYLRSAQDEVMRLLRVNKPAKADAYLNNVESCVTSLISMLAPPGSPGKRDVHYVWYRIASAPLAVFPYDRGDCPLDSDKRQKYGEASAMGQELGLGKERQAEDGFFVRLEKCMQILFKN